MNLARQLALLAALLALVLILGTTELTLVWSSRARLTELRNESIALAETWAEYLARAAPRGDTTALRSARRRAVATPGSTRARSHARSTGSTRDQPGTSTSEPSTRNGAAARTGP